MRPYTITYADGWTETIDADSLRITDGIVILITATDVLYLLNVAQVSEPRVWTEPEPEPVRSDRAGLDAAREGSMPLVAFVDEVSDPAVSAALDKALS